jgi:hypothetical protein
MHGSPGRWGESATRSRGCRGCSARSRGALRPRFAIGCANLCQADSGGVSGASPELVPHNAGLKDRPPTIGERPGLQPGMGQLRVSAFDDDEGAEAGDFAREAGALGGGDDIGHVLVGFGDLFGEAARVGGAHGDAARRQ